MKTWLGYMGAECTFVRILRAGHSFLWGVSYRENAGGASIQSFRVKQFLTFLKL
jgi:hypothetical protein